jgi:outer membrane biosynthesis protein TonB
VIFFVKADHDNFVLAAMAAMAQWRFEPPMKNGRAISVKAKQPFSFKIQE